MGQSCLPHIRWGRQDCPITHLGYECDLKLHDTCDVGSVQFAPTETGAVFTSDVNLPNLVADHAKVSCVHAVQHGNVCQVESNVEQKGSLLLLCRFIWGVARGISRLVQRGL